MSNRNFQNRSRTSNRDNQVTLLDPDKAKHQWKSSIGSKKFIADRNELIQAIVQFPNPFKNNVDSLIVKLDKKLELLT